MDLKLIFQSPECVRKGMARKKIMGKQFLGASDQLDKPVLALNSILQ